MTVVALAIAGGVGAAGRLLIDAAISRRWTNPLPVATMVINVTGSLVLGFVTGLTAERGAPHAVLLIAGTGFCGGYTTFSAASYETVRLIEGGRLLPATVQSLATVGLSLGAAAAGLLAARL